MTDRTEILARLAKTRLEVNSAENTLGRALTALKGLEAAIVAEQSAPSPTPTPVPATPAAPVVTVLPPLDFSRYGLWDWDAPWHGSEWGNPNGPIPWDWDRITRVGGDTVLTIDAGGAPQLQGMNGMAANKTGLWEAEVTLPALRSGTVVAPLWLYDPSSKDEIDFEFAGRGGLDVTMHVYKNGQDQKVSKRYFEGQDLSGTRHRFGIEVKPDVVTMLFDGKALHQFERSKQAAFVSNPLKPWIEMWGSYSNSEGWLGKFTPFAAGESMKMIVHGYRYSETSK